MGFSVTAAHVIFFVAFLGAGSAALSAYWDTADQVEDARRAEIERAASLVHGRIEVEVAACSDACAAGTRQVTLDVTNNGTTVIDLRDLSYVVDGRTYTHDDVSSASVTQPSPVSGTELVLPGETLQVVLGAVTLSASYTTQTLPVQVVSAEGIVGRP